MIKVRKDHDAEWAEKKSDRFMLKLIFIHHDYYLECESKYWIWIDDKDYELNMIMWKDK